MDAVKFINEAGRMCDFYEGNCVKCPSNQACISHNLPPRIEAERAVSIVEKWSSEHPQKTILQDFLEKHPDAIVMPPDAIVIPSRLIPIGICPHHLGYCKKDDSFCSSHTCEECWDRTLEVSKK